MLKWQQSLNVKSPKKVLKLTEGLLDRKCIIKGSDSEVTLMIIKMYPDISVTKPFLLVLLNHQSSRSLNVLSGVFCVAGVLSVCGGGAGVGLLPADVLLHHSALDRHPTHGGEGLPSHTHSTAHTLSLLAASLSPRLWLHRNQHFLK